MHMGMNHFMYKIVNLMPPKLRAFTTLYINLCVDLQEVKCRKNELPLSERKKADFSERKKSRKQRKRNQGHLREEGRNDMIFYLIHQSTFYPKIYPQSSPKGILCCFMGFC